MDLRFGHLCDYATQGAASKLVLVGLFDQLLHRTPDEPIRLPLCYLVFKLECSLSEGSAHQIRLRLKDGEEITLRDEEGKEVDFDLGAQTFKPSGPGRPLIFQMIMALGGLSFPSVDDYAFEIKVDEKVIGEIPLYVLEASGHQG
jgi:hypothetical protein